MLKLLADAEIAVGVRRVVPVHVELAIVPVHVRDVAIGIARAALCVVSSTAPAASYELRLRLPITSDFFLRQPLRALSYENLVDDFEENFARGDARKHERYTRRVSRECFVARRSQNCSKSGAIDFRDSEPKRYPHQNSASSFLGPHSGPCGKPLSRSLISPKAQDRLYQPLLLYNKIPRASAFQKGGGK